MGRLTLIVMVAATAACQSMYGAAPQRLPKVTKGPNGKQVKEPEPAIVYDDDCPVNFRGTPVVVDRAAHARAVELTVTADTTLQQAEKIEDPAARAKTVSTGIDQYSRALTKDPYSSEATLKLALAYDQVRHRGCALKLLMRIAVLENHPSYRVSARRVADSVHDNTDWFKTYRKAAIDALNGIAPPPSKP